MSGGRVVRGALAALGLAAGAMALAPRPAFAKQTPVIVVRVGGDLSARAGQYIDVPITVDLTGAPGRALGGYRLRLLYDPAVLAYSETNTGNFAEPYVNSDSAYTGGVVRFTAIQPSGASGLITLFVARFYVYADSVPSNITLDVQELTEAGTFADLLPLTQVVNGTFCRSLGTWGDTDGDGAANSRDALVALSVVVGLPVDTTMNPTLADVDADGAVTSRDALIILSFAVGLPVTGFRIGLTAAGACATGSATTLVVLPDSLELQRGQRVPVLVQARDGTGRVVPATNLTWRSDNTAVAAYVDDYYNPGIEARDAGVATLTAELGPGVRGTLEVVVIARRRNWYVDVGRALNVPTQTGSQRFPFAFIGDAVGYYYAAAIDGDTVHVASGTYEEVVSGYVSVILLGDSLNRPVVDARGSPYYYPYYPAINAGTAAAKMEVAHFLVRGGGIYVEGHDNTVRDVRIEMLGGAGTALEIYSQPFVPGAPPAGLGAASGQRDLGQVLVDNVVIDGYQNWGILIDQADTAIIRNDTVLGDSVGSYPYCYSPAAIAVYDVNASEVRANVVTNAECYGLYLEHDAGRALISGNRITAAAREGIFVSAPVIALDHNVVRDIGTALNYYAVAGGIHVADAYYVDVDSVTSVGDSILNSDHKGFLLDSARVAVIDSLVVDGTGQDSAFAGYGVELNDGRFTLTHSHVSNTARDNGVSVCGDRAVLVSRGNRVTNAGYNGLSAFDCFSVGSPDTLISIRDTMLYSYASGIFAGGVGYARVDSAEIDSTSLYNGVEFYNDGRVIVRDSRIRRATSTGFFANLVTNVEVSRNTFGQDSSNGIFLWDVTDSAKVYRNTVDSTSFAGIWLYGSVNGIVDSNVVTNSGTHGLFFDNGASGRVTRNRFANNAQYGIRIGSVYSTPLTISAAQNNITGNLRGGASNLASLYAVVDAGSNYWGDPLGPRCDSAVTGVACNPASLGDSVVTAGVTFVPFLTGSAVTPAPPVLSAAVTRARPATEAVRVAPSSAARPRSAGGARQPERQAAAIASPPPSTVRVRAQRRPFPPALRRGQEPRPPRQPTPPGAQ